MWFRVSIVFYSALQRKSNLNSFVGRTSHRKAKVVDSILVET